MKISRLMNQALIELCEAHTTTGVLTRKRTLASLATRGLAEYLGTNDWEEVTYRITEAGREALRK